MTNKSKQRARAHASKTGMSYQAAHNSLRRAKPLPDYAGFTSTSRILFRPFDGEAGGFGSAKLEMRGEIRGKNYVVHVFGQAVEIDAVDVLRDKRGSVAVLTEGRFPLHDGFVLHVEFEASEPPAEGLEPEVCGMMSVRREAPIDRVVREVVQERFGPVNPGMPVESYSLFFDIDGTLEDWQRPGSAAFLRTREEEQVRPEFEFVDVQDFDATDFDKTWVPSSAFHDPTMKRDPAWPEPEKVRRVLTLNEYIEARAKKTGWKLREVQPGQPVNFAGILPPGPAPLPDVVLNVVLVWDRSAVGAAR